MTEPLLEVKNLKVGVRKDDAVIGILQGVSFQVSEGETVGIVGESGSGKSTTGLSILRLTPQSTHRHTSGEIRFRGNDILRMSQDELRELRGRSISMILQDPMTSLNPVFRIGDQIAEAVEAHRLVAKKGIHAKVLEALQRVRIPDPERRAQAWPHQLSGGMKQRAVGAVAVSCQPDLLIADEPTTALDVTVQAQYLQMLKDLQQELNMALIFITHDFGVVARMCDRVCVMYAGRIVETAPVREIFRNPAHWYTASLINSVPSLESRGERLASIPGSPPKPGATVKGCSFAPRCANAQPKCLAETPQESTVGDHHQVSCWFPRNATAETGETSDV